MRATMEGRKEGYTVKNATDVLQVVNFIPARCNLSTRSLKKLVNFIALQGICQNQACCNLPVADLFYNRLTITSFDNPSETRH